MELRAPVLTVGLRAIALVVAGAQPLGFVLHAC